MEQAAHPPQRVVPGGARAREVPGQLLLALEDLLHHGPGPAGGLLQIAQIIESAGSAFAIPTQFIYMRGQAEERRLAVGQPERGTIPQADLMHS